MKKEKTHINSWRVYENYEYMRMADQSQQKTKKKKKKEHKKKFTKVCEWKEKRNISNT